MRPTLLALTTAALAGAALAAGAPPTTSPAAQPTVVTLYDNTKELGTLTIVENAQSIDFTVNVTSGISLLNGAHIHDVATCALVFSTTGNDYYTGTQRHGPADVAESHLGDLPMVEGSGPPTDATNFKMSSARLRLANLHGKTFVIHHDPDDFMYGDPHGHAGIPIICGAIP